MVDFHEMEEKEAKPPVDVDSVPIICTNCDSKLLTVKKVKEAPTTIKIRAKCCFCKDKTFYKEVSGAFYLAAEPNVFLEGVSEEGEAQHFIIETKEKDNVEA